MRKRSKVFSSILVVCIIITSWAFIIEPSLLIQKNISLNQWSGPPLKIAFFSDLHAGSPHIDEKYINNLILKINAMSPDIILIGGDLVINGVVGGNFMSIEKVAELLKKLKAPLGVYAVLGNHDWWSDGERIQKVLEENGIPVLDNKAKHIQFRKDFYFWLVGVGDEFTNHARVDLALSQINTTDPRVLFMHDPAALFQVKNKFFLALAGHLHGGQVYVPGVGALISPGDAPKSWASGWVDFEYGSLYVSKGIGTSIFPVRLNAPPEFVIIEFKP